MAQTANDYQQPPHDGEAELACLGGLLIKRDAIPEVRSVLKPNDFYFERNRKTFEAILAIDERSEPVEIISLKNELKKRNDFEKIGGNDYLKTIYDPVTSSANVSYYAQIVLRKSLIRQLIDQSREILDVCYREELEAEKILDFAQERIFSLGINRGTQDLKQLGEVFVEALKEIEIQMNQRKLVTGVASGLIDLDRKTTGFQPGQLVIIGARPGMGKTSLALNIAQNVGLRLNEPVVYFSLEMSANELTGRILSSESFIDSQKLRTGHIKQEEFMRLLASSNSFRDAPFYIDDNPQTTVTDVRNKLMRLVTKLNKQSKSLKLVVIDYLQLMRPADSKKQENRHQDLAEISRSLKGIARELKVPIIALTQLGRQVENRPDHEPKLADIRESGAIEQDADIVIFIHKPKTPAGNTMEGAETMDSDGFQQFQTNSGPEMIDLIIAKHRAGPQGRIKVAFFSNLTRFENHVALDDNIYR